MPCSLNSDLTWRARSPLVSKTTIRYDLGEGRERWRVLDDVSGSLQTCFELELAWVQTLSREDEQNAYDSFEATVGGWHLQVESYDQDWELVLSHQNLSDNIFALDGKSAWPSIEDAKAAGVLLLESLQVGWSKIPAALQAVQELEAIVDGQLSAFTPCRGELRHLLGSLRQALTWPTTTGRVWEDGKFPNLKVSQDGFRVLPVDHDYCLILPNGDALTDGRGRPRRFASVELAMQAAE